MSSEPAQPDLGIVLTLCLYSLAGGYADASGYLLAHSFTGHVTGNLVLFIIAIASRDVPAIAHTAAAVIAFLAATTIGQFILERSGGKLSARSILLATAVQCALIAAAPEVLLHAGAYAILTMLVCLACALGLQNGLVSSAEGVTVHTTYLTGTITTLLKSAVTLKTHPENASGLRRSIRTEAIIWISFMLGALAAALLMHRIQAHALFALEIPILMSGIVRLLRKRQQTSS